MAPHRMIRTTELHDQWGLLNKRVEAVVEAPLKNEGVRSRRSANEMIFEPERKSENYRILRSRSIASLRLAREFANDTRM